jgi:hypothetical protein
VVKVVKSVRFQVVSHLIFLAILSKLDALVDTPDREHCRRPKTFKAERKFITAPLPSAFPRRAELIGFLFP